MKDRIKDLDISLTQKVLATLGALTEVTKPEDGAVLAHLSPEEVDQYIMLRAEAKEIRTLEKALKEAKIQLDTKMLAYKARRGKWWEDFTIRHELTEDCISTGIHFDIEGAKVRVGLFF